MILRLLTSFLLFTLLSACQEREFLNQFDPKVPKTLYTLVSPVGSGQITISPSAPNYKTGETLSLTPVPSQHWVFQKWERDASGTTVPLSLTMDSNKSVVAVFVKKDYALSITIQGGGTISETIVSSPSGREYPYGTTVRLTPIPQQGWIFESWGGDLSGTDFPKNIFVDKEKNVTAKFIQPAIASLSCTAATNNGLLTAGSPAAGVNSEIPYSGGNGSAHNGQTVTSTGITGLTATLAPGTFANGNGSLTYGITGTPSGVGTASFTIIIGNQTCALTRTVSPVGSVSALNCGSATNTGILTTGSPAAGVNNQISYTGGNGNAHAGQTVTSTGVTGLTATLAPGTFANGNGTLLYTITGTPASSGTANFAINIGGRTCTISRTVSLPAGLISSLNCASASNTGILLVGSSASGVSSSIPYSGGNGGTYTAQTVNSTGVSGLTATLSAGSLVNGNGVLVYTITGIPTFSGTANFAINIGGQTCTISRTVSLPAGLISSLNCASASNTGTLLVGSSASGVSSSIPYSGGNGGTYTTQTVNSTGVSGLTATLSAGSLVNGNGVLIYTISGIPTFSGTASFALSIGGQTCTLSRSVTALVGSIGGLLCETATNSGTLIAGSATIGASSSITYTGANGGTHNGQTVSSSGVTGLTATLAPGTFANGSGSLLYTITGTPSSGGTANFAINIGGQTCTISRTVSLPAGSVFCASGATVIVEVTNPKTGKTWMDRNLGATRAANSSTDTQAYGDLYQWGRRSDGHQCRNSATTTVLSTTNQPSNGNFIITGSSLPYDWRSPQNTNLWQGVNGINNPCPSGYRLPSEAELNAERLSWSTNTRAGAFASPLKLPVAGFRFHSGGSLYDVGTRGYYWSSTVSGADSRFLYFNSSTAVMNTYNRAVGNAVRCLKD